MNKALIDTDILSYYFKGYDTVVQNFTRYLQEYDRMNISIITYYEITGGLLSKDASKQLDVFESFANENMVLPMTKSSAKISSQIFAELRSTGNTVDDIDLLIAGVAIDNEMTLVTNNESHFARIPGLRIENWSKQLY